MRCQGADPVQGLQSTGIGQAQVDQGAVHGGQPLPCHLCQRGRDVAGDAGTAQPFLGEPDVRGLSSISRMRRGRVPAGAAASCAAVADRAAAATAVAPVTVGFIMGLPGLTAG